MKKLFLILFLFMNSLVSEDRLDSEKVKNLCKAEEKKEFISTFCWLEKRKKHYNMVYQQIQLGKERAYTNWRIGYRLTKIPKDYTLKLYQVAWNPESDRQDLNSILEVYKKDQRVLVLYFNEERYRGLEPIKGWCEHCSGTVFSYPSSSIHVGCYYYATRFFEETGLRNVDGGSYIHPDILDWFIENFNLLGHPRYIKIDEFDNNSCG